MIKQLALVGAAGVLALTACSSSEKSGGSTPPPPPPSSSAASTPTTSTASTPSSSVAAEAVPISVAKTSKGSALVGPNGHALYTYDPDTATVSSCSGQCAAAWPPLVGTPQPGAGLTAADFDTIKRDDGSMQITYNQHPLYYYVKDESASDVTGDGDGVGGVWHLATSDGSAGGAPSSSDDNGGGRGY